jgi:hypothetical protein
MQTNQVFKVVIVYENFGAAVQAKEMSERLAAELNSKCDTWKFEMLAHPGLREHAARDAAEADMIIVAARGEGPLPDYVKEWIQTWLPCKKESPAILVALIDEESNRVNRENIDREDAVADLPDNFQYLRQVAERGAMDFLSNLDHFPAPATEELQQAPEPSPSITSPDLLVRRRRYELTQSCLHCHAT